MFRTLMFLLTRLFVLFFSQMYSFVYAYVVNNCIYIHEWFIVQISPQADLPNWQHVSSTPIIGQICFKAFHCKQLVAFCCCNGLCTMLMRYRQDTRLVIIYIYKYILYISKNDLSMKYLLLTVHTLSLLIKYIINKDIYILFYMRHVKAIVSLKRSFHPIK